MAGPIEIHPLKGLGEVRPGDDLAQLLAPALGVFPALDGRDVLVVTSKIVSKAEGRFLDLGRITPSEEALRLSRLTLKDPRFVEAVLAQSASVVRAAPGVLITRHRLGYVMANAGIDRSNLGPGNEGRLLLLPENPDRSAERLRATLASRLGVAPAVLISDSFGRPWRQGVVNVALGASGFPALADLRGMQDRDGRPLEVTQTALADMAASAAGLVAGEGAEGVPAVLIRGLSWTAPDAAASALIRPAAQDLFL